MPRSQSRTPTARSSARASTPRQARTAKQAKAAHRGGEWGRGVAERLRRLKEPLGVRAFAERMGLSASLVSSYLNGGRLPDAGTLRTIAERTGASLDWLLLGEGGEAPRYRGQSRPQAELEADVAAYVARAYDADNDARRFSASVSTAFGPRWEVDGAAVLASVVAREIDATRAWYDWQRGPGAALAYAEGVDDSLRTLAEQVDQSPPDPGKVATAVATLRHMTTYAAATLRAATTQPARPVVMPRYFFRGFGVVLPPTAIQAVTAGQAIRAVLEREA